MFNLDLSRRSFGEALLAVPFGLSAQTQQTPSLPLPKIAAGQGHSNEVINLPGGDALYVKVSTQDSSGALFLTEQPIARRGTGPPKHYHEEQDEWFYCLAGEYVIEIGDQRSRLTPGDSVLVPRRVPHAFVYDAPGIGRLLVGFAPARTIEQFFRDLAKRGQYFGNGTADEKEMARRLYGIVNVGPPLKL